MIKPCTYSRKLLIASESLHCVQSKSECSIGLKIHPLQLKTGKTNGVLNHGNQPMVCRLSLLSESREILLEAESIVRRREALYRVPAARIASWRENPTVYRYGYLWAVHSLYYWWRDQGLAEEGNMFTEITPCYLNRMDVTEIAVGWGKYTLELLRSFINKYSPFSTGHPIEIVNCIAPPSRPYKFPQDLVL